MNRQLEGTMEQQTPKPSKEYHSHHKTKKGIIKLNRKIVSVTGLLILIVFMGIFSYGLGHRSKADSKDLIIYIYPQNCNSDVCNLDEIAKLMKNVPVTFYKADFVNFPIIISMNNGEAKLIEASSKAKIVEGLCSLGIKDFCEESKQAEFACEGISKSEKPSLLLFYMTYCPYGQQAFQGLYPVLKIIGDKINFKPTIVIYENYRGGGDDYCIDSGKLCSMHGINELNEGIRQICVFNNYGLDIYLEYTKCVMDSCSLSNVEECWKTCTTKNKVDAAVVSKCQETEAIPLMTKDREQNLKYQVTGSPTILLNEKKYTGGRAPENFKQGICCGFNTVPKECEQVLGQTSATTTASC